VGRRNSYWTTCVQNWSQQTCALESQSNVFPRDWWQHPLFKGDKKWKKE
jgi:hypothetical protein